MINTYGSYYTCSTSTHQIAWWRPGDPMCCNQTAHNHMVAIQGYGPNDVPNMVDPCPKKIWDAILHRPAEAKNIINDWHAYKFHGGGVNAFIRTQLV